MWELWSNVVLLWMLQTKRQGNVKQASQTHGWGPSLGLPTEIKDSSQGLVQCTSLKNNVFPYLHPRPLFVFGLKCKTHLARPRFLPFIKRYFLQYVTIMLIKHKININNLGLSFISVGRPRRGPWPGVCFAHFTFPHLWVWHHPQHNVTLEQSSRIVTHQEWSDLKINITYITVKLLQLIGKQHNFKKSHSPYKPP